METYCAFTMAHADNSDLAEKLEEIVAQLEPAAEAFRKILGSGGSACYHISWTAGDRGEIFSSCLMQRIAGLGIDLVLVPVAAR